MCAHVQAQPEEIPSWARSNLSLPVASEAARSRHALLPNVSSTRCVALTSLSMGPLYPAFDSTPIAPIDYGPPHTPQAAPPLPSAPPMPQQVRTLLFLAHGMRHKP